MGKKKSINKVKHNIDGVDKADSGDFLDALRDFNKAIKADPTNYVAYFNRASVKMKLGDIEGARLDFKKSSMLNNSENRYL